MTEPSSSQRHRCCDAEHTSVVSLDGWIGGLFLAGLLLERNPPRLVARQAWFVTKITTPVQLGSVHNSGSLAMFAAIR
jgi:hypothetical protein